MYAAEGRMHGNSGTFIVERADDGIDAVSKLRRCYQYLMADGTASKVAKKLSPDVEEEIWAILSGESKRKYEVYPMDDRMYFIEFFEIPGLEEM